MMLHAPIPPSGQEGHGLWMNHKIAVKFSPTRRPFVQVSISVSAAIHIAHSLRVPPLLLPVVSLQQGSELFHLSYHLAVVSCG